MYQLNEDSRKELINKSKHADNYVTDQSKGKNRYQRRLHSKVMNSVQEFNSIDMNSFFKDDTLLVNVKVHGETDDYVVQIKFSGMLKEMQNQLSRFGNEDAKIDLRIITKSLVTAFNSGDVYIHCSCPDWTYRMSYWSRVNDTSSDPSIEQTNNGREIVNPFDTKGRGCKHALLVISNNRWIRSVASVIFNYINYMEKHYPKLYADIIYPAIYDRPYEDDVQLSIDDIDNDNQDLKSTEDEIDISNKWAKTKGQFKQGNQSGVQFASDKKEIPGQKSFNFDSLVSD